MAAPTGTSTAHGANLHINEDWELSDGNFFRIKRFINQDHTDETLVEGDLFRLVGPSVCMLPELHNELCLMVIVGHDGRRVWSAVRPTMFARRRRIILTNMAYPAFCNRTLQLSSDPVETENLKAATPLLCRWKTTTELDVAGQRELSCSIESLREHEVGPTERVADAKSRADWVTGLASASYVSSKRLDHHEGSEEELARHGWAQGGTPCKTALCNEKELRRRRYRFGDLFAGAGGASAGAHLAGLATKYHVDICRDACVSLWLNGFSGVLNEDVFGFVGKAFRDPVCFHVDVLHLSPPCGYYSHLHTRCGQNDAHNLAANLCVEEVLHVVRPRIVTMEQTAALVTRDEGIHFRTLIAAFTWCNFSVRWRVVNLAAHGNAQARRRLIIVAAARGEMLPTHPKPTHGDGLLPLTTIQDVLDGAEREPSAVPSMTRSTAKDGDPYDAKQPLRQCVTTNGGFADLHPNGNQTFTAQQLAMLQGFPASYDFFGTLTSKRRQIGNAVPPCYTERLFRSVIETLERTDGAEHNDRDLEAYLLRD